YGRGGIGGDSIRAEGQDFSGRNNANMSTPADGGRPRMQMFIFDGIGIHSVTVLSGPHTGTPFDTGTAAFGPQAFDTSAPAVLVNDGVAGGTTSDGCETPFVNAADVVGRIAVVDRGFCSFSQKAARAKANGAIGLVIVNNVPGVGNLAATVGFDDNIATLLIGLTEGTTLKGDLALGPVSVRMLRQAGLDRDGTIDNQVMAHEWGHYISNRLVGNANGLTTNMSRGMGEGWADFHAMLLTVKQADATTDPGASVNATYNGVYSLAGYVTFGKTFTGGGNNGYYFGIRRVPYSTDLTKNALSFKHVQNGVPLPPGVPTSFGLDGSNNAEVHNTGEVWATMLWECYASLLRDTVVLNPDRPGLLSFDEARNRMKDYIVAAYMATPPNPTMLEARDAVLAAAYATDLVDYQEFLAAFAKRGAGIGAVAPDRWSADNSGSLVESASAANDLVFASATLFDTVASCDRDNYLDAGETGRLTVTLRNDGLARLLNTTATITSLNPSATFPGGASDVTLTFAASNPLETVSAGVDVSLDASAVGPQTLGFSITFGDTGSPGGTVAPKTVAFTPRGNVDDVLGQQAIDDVESIQPRFTTVNLRGTSPPGPVPSWTRQELSGTDHNYRGPDSGFLTDLALMSPNLTVGVTDLTLSFRQRYQFEAPLFDGGVVEITADNGVTWTDIGSLATAGKYNGTLAAGSPLAGRTAFVNTSAGYPAFLTTIVPLGTAYAGKTVRVRFRIGTDTVIGTSGGWEVDDIAFTGLANEPFPKLLTNKCSPTTGPNRLPTASIAAVTPKPERTTFVLDGTASSDPDGDPLSFRWTQVSGPVA
ncbi:MAG TPA: M36 family metallopeptidase, partial [Acidimicrobiales bacterium]|nr:M36 family metallopeptidase [Acidimicrobiales bacterium]